MKISIFLYKLVGKTEYFSYIGHIKQLKQLVMQKEEKEYYIEQCQFFIKNTKDKTAKKEVKELIQYLNKHNWNGSSPKKDDDIYKHMRIYDNKYGIF